MSPYENLPAAAFWRSGVQAADPTDMRGIYRRKFEIKMTDRVATAGSCFAQHIARHLRANGYSVLDVEPAPPGIQDAEAKRFGFNLFSGRYGNIYTARQLRQLITEVLGRFKSDDPVWVKDGRFYDSQRPNAEPEGLDSPDEVTAHRTEHLRALRGLFRQTDILVFTFGLTEAWTTAGGSTVFPTAPGTIAGVFDPAKYVFKNYSFAEVQQDFLDARRMLKRFNPAMKFLVTVSPVPLTATASGSHVLVSSTYSKSVLRAVAGALAATNDDIDYFPSYEIITNPGARSRFYGANLRSVEEEGVASVMRAFFSEHSAGSPATVNDTHAASAAVQASMGSDLADVEGDLVCEELLLEAFARKHA